MVTGASPAGAESCVRATVFPVESTPLISQKKLTSYNVQGPLFVMVNNDARGLSQGDELWMTSWGRKLYVKFTRTIAAAI
jgi:hypothetical protein